MGGEVVSFEAKYPGTCGSCGERIGVGDVCKYDSTDSVMHEDCDGAYEPERKTETCTQCWLIKPCECDS